MLAGRLSLTVFLAVIVSLFGLTESFADSIESFSPSQTAIKLTAAPGEYCLPETVKAIPVRVFSDGPSMIYVDRALNGHVCDYTIKLQEGPEKAFVPYWQTTFEGPG